MDKGRRTENEAIELYERAGYNDTYLPPLAKFRNQDVFELFDLLAVRDGELAGTQVKTNRNDGIRQWFEDAKGISKHVDGLRIGYAVLIEDEGWKFAEPTPDGYEWVVDEREMDCNMGEGVVQYLRGEA